MDAEAEMAIAREVISGVEESESKFAPLDTEQSAVWKKYTKVVADAPPGAIIETPWSASEMPDDDERFSRYEASLNELRHNSGTEKAKRAIDRLREKGE